MAKSGPTIFDTPPAPEAEEQAWAEGDADIAAGRLVPHEDVAKWLATWGGPDYQPMPEDWWK